MACTTSYSLFSLLISICNTSSIRSVIIERSYVLSREVVIGRIR